MATRKKKDDIHWPIVTKGSHLTVTAYEDGRTELVWDDEQLLKEVNEATKSVLKPNIKAKAVQRKNKIERNKILNSVELSLETIEKAKKSSKKSNSKNKE